MSKAPRIHLVQSKILFTKVELLPWKFNIRDWVGVAVLKTFEDLGGGDPGGVEVITQGWVSNPKKKTMFEIRTGR